MEEERVSAGKLFGVRPTDECRTWTGGDHLYRMETGVLTIGLHRAASPGSERDSIPSGRPSDPAEQHGDRRENRLTRTVLESPPGSPLRAVRESDKKSERREYLFISSEMGLSDRTGETGLARFRAPAVGLRDHELRGVRRTPRRAGSASASGVRDATEMTGGRRADASCSRGRGESRGRPSVIHRLVFRSPIDASPAPVRYEALMRLPLRRSSPGSRYR